MAAAAAACQVWTDDSPDTPPAPPYLDLLSGSMSLSGSNLVISFKLKDLSNLPPTSGFNPLVYEMRWQQGTKSYFANGSVFNTPNPGATAQDGTYDPNSNLPAPYDEHAVNFTGNTGITPTASFDTAAGTVTINVPLPDVKSSTGASLSNIFGITYQAEPSPAGAVWVPADRGPDTGGGTYTVGGPCAVTTSPSPGSGLPTLPSPPALQPPPTVPESPAAASLLPVSGLGTAILAAALMALGARWRARRLNRRHSA